MPYPPRLALEDAQVLTKHITTKENTNLMKNAETAVEAIRQEDAALADEVSKVQKKNKNQNALRGIDKTKKTRQRSWLLFQYFHISILTPPTLHQLYSPIVIFPAVLDEKMRFMLFLLKELWFEEEYETINFQLLVSSNSCFQ